MFVCKAPVCVAAEWNTIYMLFYDIILITAEFDMKGRDTMAKAITLDEIKNVVSVVASSYPVSKVAIFGSLVKNEHDDESDIDMLVEFKENKTGFLFIDMKQRLEDETGRSVDLFTYESMERSKFGSQVLKEAKVIYEKQY